MSYLPLHWLHQKGRELGCKRNILLGGDLARINKLGAQNWQLKFGGHPIFQGRPQYILKM